MRGARAEQEQALAEEQAARARRERAEVQERTALAEQEARERAARAGEEQAAADELRAKAEKIAPTSPTTACSARPGTVDRSTRSTRSTRLSGRRRHPPLSSGRPDRLPLREARTAPEMPGLDPVGPRSYGHPHVDPSTSEGCHDRPAGHRDAQGAVARAQ